MPGIQRERRSNPYPWSWELPAGVAAGVFLVMLLGAHGARSVANAIAGGGWAFTELPQMVTSLPAILRGDSLAGLAQVPEAHASRATLLIAIGLVEVLVVAMVFVGGVAAVRRFGPARVRGMATAAEAESLLGISRLRRNANVIRPDLHPSGKRGRD